MSGESGQSQWITNFPYPGSEDVVVPIRTDLSALASIKVSSADEFNDCAKAAKGCVLYVRTDHRSTGNRAFDVRVPLQFTKSGAAAMGTEAGAQTVGADGKVRLTWTVPTAFAVGKHTVALIGPAGTLAATSFTVKAKPGAGQPPPGSDGSDGLNGSDGSNGSDGTDGTDRVDKQLKPTSSLAETGGTATGPLVAGGVLLAVGVLLLLLTCRRRQSVPSESGPLA